MSRNAPKDPKRNIKPRHLRLPSPLGFNHLRLLDPSLSLPRFPCSSSPPFGCPFLPLDADIPGTSKIISIEVQIRIFVVTP
nr:hypothetical protein CFP56_06474 [Quercus suber]